MNIFCSCLRPISSMHSENAIFKTVTWWKPPVSFHVLSHFHVMSFHESWRFMYWVILSWWYFLVMSFHGSWRFMYRVIFSWCRYWSWGVSTDVDPWLCHGDSWRCVGLPKKINVCWYVILVVFLKFLCTCVR